MVAGDYAVDARCYSLDMLNGFITFNTVPSCCVQPSNIPQTKQWITL